MNDPLDELAKLKGEEGRTSSGDMKQFLLGMLMSLIGGYLIINQIQVRSNFWGRRLIGWGGVGVTPFSISLIFFLFGVGFIFYDAKKWWGWLLAGGALLFMLIGVIASLQLYFVSTPLYVLLGMFILFVGGLGLMARSLK